MDTDSFKVNIKTENVYKDTTNDVEKRFGTSNHVVERPLSKGNNKNVIGLMKDELGGKIMTEFVRLKPKTYSYLINDDRDDNKAKGGKECVISRRSKSEGYKNVYKMIKLY